MICKINLVDYDQNKILCLNGFAVFKLSPLKRCLVTIGKYSNCLGLYLTKIKKQKVVIKIFFLFFPLDHFIMMVKGMIKIGEKLDLLGKEVGVSILNLPL